MLLDQVTVTSIVVEQGSFQTELRIVGNSNKLVYFHHVDFKNLRTKLLLI